MLNYEEKALRYIEENRKQLFDCLSDLLGFDSQNFISHGNEKPCAEYIQQLYLDLGLETELYSPDSVPGITGHQGYLAGRGLGERPNVSGVLRGMDPSSSVMVAAHIDTMPVGDLANWTVDPFGGLQKDGRIYGLGAGDNKFGIAAGIFAVKAILSAGLELQKNIVLTSYVDEEYGGGCGALAAGLKYPCETVVNLDGGNFDLWTAALGGCGYKLEIKTDGVTDTARPVVAALYKIQQLLEAFGQRRRDELHANPLYTNSDMERSAYRLMGFHAGDFGSNLGNGTIEFVIYTDKSKEQIQKELLELEREARALLDGTRLRTDGFIPTTRFFDYGEMDDQYCCKAIMKQAAMDGANIGLKECGACLSDLSVFLKYITPCSFNFGIMRDFALYGGAHQPDEYVDCEAFTKITKTLTLFLIRYCVAQTK